MPFSILIILCNYYLYVVLKHFHHPQGDPISIKHSLPVSSPPQPVAIISLLSVSMDLADLDISYRWNHPVFILLPLVYFTLYSALRFIHVVSCPSAIFLFMAEYYFIVCICSILLIHVNKVLPWLCSIFFVPHLGIVSTAFSQGSLMHS